MHVYSVRCDCNIKFMCIYMCEKKLFHNIIEE